MTTGTEIEEAISTSPCRPQFPRLSCTAPPRLSCSLIVFAVGKYEKDVEAGWSDGDWNGDGLFNSADLVAALADGGYEQGPRPAAVPEPETLSALLIGLIALASVSKSRHKLI